MSGLTRFQTDVARLFFRLPSSEGFVLAGGGALLASALSSRPTRDLDFFGAVGAADVDAAFRELTSALLLRGVSVHVVRRSSSFVRLHLFGPEELVVDLCVDTAPQRPPVMSAVGPTFDAEELAGRKLLALFSRAEARDFVDVFVMSTRLSKGVMVRRAAEVDSGFDATVLSGMLRTIDRFSDDEPALAQVDVGAMRLFFRSWADEIDGANGRDAR